MKKVSIVTPCYNSEKYIGRYLNSMLNQTYTNLELILINDGSTDNTLNIIDEYKRVFRQRGIEFKCINKSNGGAASAINVGLKEFSGDYLIWPDSDDYLVNDSIEKRVKFLEQNPHYGLVRSDANIVNEAEPTKVIGQISRKKSNRFADSIFDDLIYEKTYCTPGCYMVRREVVLDCIPDLKIYESRGGQNWQILLPVTLKYRVGFIDESLYVYVVRQDSHSHSPLKKGFNSLIEQIKGHEDILVNTIKTLPIDRIRYYSIIELKYKKIQLILADLYEKDELCQRLYKDLVLYVRKYPQFCEDNNIYVDNGKYFDCNTRYNVVVFGVGSYYDKFKEIIKKNYNIIAFADNDSTKIGGFKDNLSIISPNDLHLLEYDKILVTSSYFTTICEQLISLGVNSKDIEVVLYHSDNSKIIVTEKGRVMFNYQDINLGLEDIYRWLIP